MLSIGCDSQSLSVLLLSTNMQSPGAGTVSLPSAGGLRSTKQSAASLFTTTSYVWYNKNCRNGCCS